MTWEYVAGFFDGEGNITIYDYERKRVLAPDRITTYQEKQVKISMAQKTRIIVNMVQLKNGIIPKINEFLIAEGINSHIHKTDRFDIQRLQFSSRESCKIFLEKIIPYLFVKKEKAQLALDFILKNEREVYY